MSFQRRYLSSVAAGLAIAVTASLTLTPTATAAPTPTPTLQRAAAAADDDVQSVYVPITPCRIVDTRSGSGVLTPGSQRTFQVTGSTGFSPQGGAQSGCGIPSGATAIEASVTGVAPVGGGFLRVWPAGQTMPNATFLNFQKDASITNTGTVTLSTTGQIAAKVFGAATSVVVDVQGYFVSRSSATLPASASLYVPITPCRIVDTRVQGGPLSPSASRSFQVTGSTGFDAQGGRATCGIPSGSTAVEAAVSAVGPAGSGFLRLWPAAAPMPGATFLNYPANTGITNTGAISLAGNGRIDAKSFGHSTALVIDVQGYFLSRTAPTLPDTASQYVPITPCRIADTRPARLPLGTDLARTWQVAGTSGFDAQGGRSDCGIPEKATAVEVSLSAVAPTGTGFLRSWPSDALPPTATFMNYAAGQSITNTGSITLSALGSIEVRTFGSRSDGVADVQGYFVAAAGSGSAPTITTTELPSAVHGFAYSATLDVAGGTAPYFWSASGLPDGLSMDYQTGAITGNAYVDGTQTVAVTVTDNDGVQTSVTLPLTVKAGMPSDCDYVDCAFLSQPAGSATVEITGDDVTDLTRDGSGDPVALELSEFAPAVLAGNYLSVGIGGFTPEGVVLKVLTVTGDDGSARSLTVQRASLFDAHPDGLVKGTGTVEEIPAAEGVQARAAVAGECSGSAQLQAVPSVSTSVDPSVTVLWGRNLFGFGDVFVGTGGLETFQFDTTVDLTYNLFVSASGSVSCSLKTPGVRALIPLGAAGAAVFKLEPHLGVQVSGRIDVNTSVTIRCGINYTWRNGSGGDLGKYCRPIVSPPTADADNTGADLTVSGGITASLTYNEAIGISGDLTASVHAGYHPLQHPQGVLDGKVTGELSLCLACILDDDAPTLTLLSGTIFERVFYTWDSTTPATASISALTTSNCIVTGTMTTTADGPYGMQVWDDGQLIGSAWGTFRAGRAATLSYIVRAQVLQGASGLGILLVNQAGQVLDSVDPYNGADSCFGGGAARQSSQASGHASNR